MGRALFASSLFLVTVGCVRSNVAKVQHDAGQPTQSRIDSNPMDWAQGSDAMQRFEADHSMMYTLAPPGDLAEQKAQSIMDRIDAHLRSQSGPALAKVPRPRARVLVNSDVNAYVSAVSTCFQVPVKIEGGAGPAGGRLSLDANGGLYPMSPEDSCSEGGPVSPAHVVDWFARNLGNCTVRVEGQAVVFGRDCDVGGEVRPSALDGVRVNAASPVVAIFTGMVRLMPSEAEFAAVMAHELGHFYKNHPAISEQKYNYFYYQEENAQPKKPERREDLRALAMRVSDAQFAEPTPRIPGQKYNVSLLVPPEVQIYLANVIVEACGENRACRTECEPYAMMLSEGRALAFKSDPEDARTRQQYLELEARVEKCYAQIPISTSGRFTPEYTQEVFNAAQPAAEADLRQFLEAESQRLFRREADAESVLQEALGKRLGYYTHEQEADELSAEWLAAIGIDPHAAVRQAFLSMEKLQKSSDADPINLSFHRCRKLADNGWRDDSGRLVLVPLGHLSAPHHSFCYRAFNLDREIKAHAYRVDTSGGPLGGAPWSAVVEEAARQEAALMGNPGAGEFGGNGYHTMEYWRMRAEKQRLKALGARRK